MTRLGSLVICAIAAAGLAARQPPAADLILHNGRVVTVDARFSIAEAVAVRGGRIAAVGRNADVLALAGPATERRNLEGRAVIPGLIDNHMHLLRAGATWQREVRLDGVPSRSEALDRLRARAAATTPGDWIYTLGGWTLEQFADDPRPFMRDELDRAAPANPVFLQASYHRAYVNSRGATALGVAGTSAEIGEDRLRGLAARLPVATGAELETSTRQMIADLNRAGLTAVGSAGCEPDILSMYHRWSDRDELNIRVFCITGLSPGTPGQVTAALPRIRDFRVRYTEDPFVDHIAYGEGVYGPLHDPMFVQSSNPQPAQLAEWRRIATEVARARLPLHVHANLRPTIGAFLDQIEAIDGAHPVRDLRWTLAHVNQIEASHLERMKTLGMMAAVHPWAVINGGINQRVFGDAAADMAPLRALQQSGVRWGLGSDGSRANQVLPFHTLSWAVTGRMVGGREVLRQTISREDALVAHTRNNAFLVFREQELGSIEVGKRADLVVLSDDYLTVPAERIKDIQSVLTIVNGRIAYAAPGVPAAR